MVDGQSTKRVSVVDPSTDALADQLYTEQRDGTLLGRATQTLQQAASHWAKVVGRDSDAQRLPVRPAKGQRDRTETVGISDARVGVIVAMLAELHARMEPGLRSGPMNAGDLPSAVVAEMATHLRCLVDPTPPLYPRVDRSNLDPNEHLLVHHAVLVAEDGSTGLRPVLLKEAARGWSQRLAAETVPDLPPSPPTRRRRRGRRPPAPTLVSAQRALVVAEMLDELALRLRPGTVASRMHGGTDIGDVILDAIDYLDPSD